jgi:hypothetical protein
MVIDYKDMQAKSYLGDIVGYAEIRIPSAVFNSSETEVKLLYVEVFITFR